MSSSYFGVCSGLVLVVLHGCSSARVDPNTGAFTLYSPSQSSPQAPGTAGTVNASAPKVPSAGTGGLELNQGAAYAGAATELAAKEPRLPHCASLPDPAPTRTDHWVDLALHFDHGKIELTGSTPRRSRKPDSTKRMMGRFAAELWIGCELIDRVRFDFPLLAVGTASIDPRAPSFEVSGSFDAVISVPDSDRATRLELIDRATTERRLLDWPIRPAK